MYTPSGRTVKVTIVDLFYSNKINRIPTWNIMVWFVAENNPFILRHPPFGVKICVVTPNILFYLALRVVLDENSSILSPLW